MKNCSICNIKKSEDSFWKNKSSLDRLQNKCKECALRTNNQWRKNNKEKLKAIKEKYYRKNKAKILSRGRAYRLRRPEINRKSVKRWREKNIEKARFLIKRWAKNNPGKRKHSYAVRRFLKRANGGEKIPLWVWEGVKNVFENKCFYCGKKTKLTMDHYIPLSKGGLHILENIVPACQSCNCKKHAMMPEVFQARQRRKVFA